MYKIKWDKMDPDNFRAITLISCLGKLFTSIINSRMTFCANEISLISKNQDGFRKGHSTTDNLFVLHSLISLYPSFGKKYIVLSSISAMHSTLFGEVVCGKKITG